MQGCASQDCPQDQAQDQAQDQPQDFPQDCPQEHAQAPQDYPQDQAQDQAQNQTQAPSPRWGWNYQLLQRNALMVSTGACAQRRVLISQILDKYIMS